MVTVNALEWPVTGYGLAWNVQGIINVHIFGLKKE